MSNSNTAPIMHVNLHDLKVDHTYQRPLELKRVEAIVARFDPGLTRLPVASIRDNGEIYLIDGQHTVEILKRVGTKGKIAVQYHKGLTIAQEARKFRELNRQGKEGSMPVSIECTFNSSLVSEEPLETEISQIVETLGLSIRKPGKTGINTFESLYYAHGNGNLSATLYTLREWCPDDKRQFENGLIRGVSAFFKTFPNASPERLIKVLKPFSPSEIKFRFMRAKKELGELGVSYKAQVSTLQELYNKKMRSTYKVF